MARTAIPTRRLASALVAATALVPGTTGCEGGGASGAAVGDGTLPTVAAAVPRALLYGRVTVYDGTTYEGRLRFGGDEEALWGNTFNGFRRGNPWKDDVPRARRSTQRVSLEVAGVELAAWSRRLDLGRPFMARFGDIVRIDPDGRDIRVTLKSGTEAVLDRYSADDLADGLRVWDESRGVVDIGEWDIRSIELLPSAGADAAPYPLYGTVRTRQGTFTGLIQWDREACLDTDELRGQTGLGEVMGIRFEDVASIERRSADSSLVTLRDGRALVLSGMRQVGAGNRGAYVDDARYGRVLVSWEVLERVDFTPGSGGPAYDGFPAGHRLTGRVITRSGRTLAGRLVYDLDESETTETLDAPSGGLDYTIPFGSIASVALAVSGDGEVTGATVTLRGGEALSLDPAGDLGPTNAGVLVFGEGEDAPAYVPWTDVERIEFDGVSAT